MRQRRLIVGLLLALSFSSVALASDVSIPPLSGVCDGLAGGTPALYGLCIAYCEAPLPDTDHLLNPNAPPRRAILDRYHAAMQPGDPDMPCLQPVCTCWTEAELAVLFDSASEIQCAFDDGTNTNANDIWMFNTPADDSFLEVCFPYGLGFPVAFSAEFFGGTDHTCAFLPASENPYQGPIRFFAITDAAHDVCKASLQNRAAALSETCVALEDLTYGGGISCYP